MDNSKWFLTNKKNQKLIFGTLLTVSLGSVFYHFVEGWSWLDSVYFSVMTLTTVGYGDLTPQSDWSKLFTILYVLTGIGLIFAFMNEFFQHQLKSNSSGSLLNFFWHKKNDSDNE